MIVYPEAGFNHKTGSSVSMNAKGQWTQVGNDYGYTLNSSGQGINPARGLIQKGSFRASDGDWYMVDETTHTIKRNYWATGYDHDESINLELIGARTFYNFDGKAEKIQFPLRRGTFGGNFVFDESEAKIYDIISSPDTQAAALIDAVNKYRSSHGASTLVNDKALLTISSIFSTYLPMNSEYSARMIGNGGLSDLIPYYRNHCIFMLDGQVAGGHGTIAAKEFISVGKWDVNEIVQEWATQKIMVYNEYNSMTHNRDIYEDCTPSLTDGTCVGASCYVDANGTPYWYMLIG